jgi:hypothetical protein
MATTGSQIILYLADKSKQLSAAVGSITLPEGDPIIGYVERWMAVTGMGEEATEKYSEPVSLSSQPTIPDMALRAAPDLLQEAMNLTGGGNGVPLAKA